MLFLALTYTDAGLNDPAIATYQELLRYDAGLSTAWSNLGLLYKKEGRHAESLECYENAVMHNDKNPFAWNNLAQAYLTSCEWEKVIEPAERALAIKADLHPAETALTVAYYALGDEEKSKFYYNRAILHGANGANVNNLLHRIAEGKELFE